MGAGIRRTEKIGRWDTVDREDWELGYSGQRRLGGGIQRTEDWEVEYSGQRRLRARIQRTEKINIRFTENPELSKAVYIKPGSG